MRTAKISILFYFVVGMLDPILSSTTWCIEGPHAVALLSIRPNLDIASTTYPTQEFYSDFRLPVLINMSRRQLLLESKPSYLYAKRRSKTAGNETTQKIQCCRFPGEKSSPIEKMAAIEDKGIKIVVKIVILAKLLAFLFDSLAS